MKGRKTTHLFPPILLIMILTIVLSQCATLGDLMSGITNGSSQNSSQPPKKAETGDVTGVVLVEKNNFYLNDGASDIRYKFVGLKKGDKERLTGLNGKVVTVRLKVISTESAKARNASLIEIVKP